MNRKKIYIYGTGCNSKKILEGGINGEIIGYVETNPKNEFYEGKKIYYPHEIKVYDAIIVASIYTDEIYQIIKENRLEMEKVIFMFPGLLINYGENKELAKEILEIANYTTYCASHKLFKESFFEEDKKKYMSLNKRETFQINESDLYPIITDKYHDMGSINTYFWQDLWAAKLVHRNQPKEHCDIGSRMDGFIAHILSMDIPIKVIDVRPFPQKIENMSTVVADATNMSAFEDESIESLSALCSLEHFGLGRYGDKVDPEACFKVFEKIQDKMKTGGKLYISVPIGKEKLQFNAHRIFYASTIIESFSRMVLKELSCTYGDQIKYNIDIHEFDTYEKDAGVYGLFYFEKK